MTVFVSYARRDNDLSDLQQIENLLSPWAGRLEVMLSPRARPYLKEMLSSGRLPYIDDLHYRRYGTDRHEAVEAALTAATAFLAVQSPMYGKTPWTVKEFASAHGRGVRIFTLSSDRKTIELYEPQGQTDRIRHEPAQLYHSQLALAETR